MATAADAPQVLVVDDDPDLRHLLTLALEHEGYRVCAAANGDDAHEAIRRGFRADLAILDLHLGEGIDGFELGRQLRSTRGETLIIFLTKAGDLEDRLSGFDAGADDYLPKP